MRLLSTALVLALALAARAASAADMSYTMSVAGPGQGKGNGALGLGVATFGPGELVTPSISYGYSYGISEHVDFLFTGDAAFVFAEGFGVLGTLDPGFMFRVTDRSAAGALGLRFSPEIVFLAAGSDGGGAGGVGFGLVPGLVGSFGNADLQVTLGVELPVYLGAAAAAGDFSGAAGALALTVRPSLTIESAVNDSVAVYVRAAPQFLLTEEPQILLVQASVGLTF